MADEDRPTVQVNLRLDPRDLARIDEARLGTVSRNMWIRGAIYRRLGRAIPATPVEGISRNTVRMTRYISEDGASDERA